MAKIIKGFCITCAEYDYDVKSLTTKPCCKLCDEFHSNFKPRKSKVVNINGGPPPEQQPLHEAVQEMKAFLPDWLEYVAVKATITRASYLALIKENFTHDEAMEICSKQPLVGGM